FAGMNLRSIQSTDAKAETLFRDYVAVRLITTALALAGTVVVALVSYEAPVRQIVLIAGLVQASDWLSDLTFGLFEQRERFEIVARSVAIRGPLRLVGLALALALTHDLRAGMYVELVLNTLVLLLHDIPVA